MNAHSDFDAGHRGLSLHLGLVATIFVLLFTADLVLVSAFGMALGIRPPFFPGPTVPADQVVAYFQTHALPVLVSSFLQFGAAVTLGIFAAGAVDRLRMIGARGAGPAIALFGGFAASLNMAASAFTLWVTVHPHIVQNPTLIPALHALSFVFGGPGFSVPMALFVSGVSLAARSMRVMPAWVIRLGLLIAAAGAASWFSWIMVPLMIPRAGLFIPLTRFPAFVWLIAAGVKLSAAALPTTATATD